MEYSIKHLLWGGSSALLAGSLLVGCAATDKQRPVAAAPAAQVAPAEPAGSGTAERPGVAEGELLVMTAKVKAIDKKNRVVTLRTEDGKDFKVKCGPEVRNFPQIRVGDDVTAEFLETVELFVTGPQGEPTADVAREIERAPKGGKPGMVAVETMEVTAVVEAIDYQTRAVTLKGPEGKVYHVKAGPEVKRLNQIKKGDTVVARYSQALAIKVSTPQKE